MQRWHGSHTFDKLATRGTTTTFEMGSFNSTTKGYGTALLRSVRTAAFRCYTDDGGSVLTGTGSVPDIRAGLTRFLVTKDNTGGHIRLWGLMGQLKAYDGFWNTEQTAAVHGRLELVRSVATMTFGGYGITAAIAGTVATSGAITVDTNHILAGVAAIADFRATLTQTGKTVGVYVGKYDTTNWSDGTARTTWGYGIYIDALAVTKGLLIGVPWAGISKMAYTGMKPNITDSWSSGAPVGFYFDDGGIALTKWGECFTVGQAVLTASTGAAQTGWPYTAFFYTDVEANITSATNQHWPTLMTSFIVGTGVTLRGFSVGASSHHASVDVNGTLYAGSKLSCISFGGNWPGTVNGTIVPLHVRPTNQVWSAFLQIDDGAGGCVTATPLAGGTSQYLKVLYNDVAYTILMTRAS